MFMAPIAATSITIMTIMITMTKSTITPMRLMDAPSPDPRSAALAPFPELPLLIWLSPAFPVGSFAYSHGLEWAAEVRDIVDAASLQRWLVDLIAFGAPPSACVLVAAGVPA